jgi:alkylhydroperoxidase family enzyme
MTRLAHPDPAHVAHLMQDFQVPLRHMNIGKTVSHAPTLVAPYYNTYAAVLHELELDAKLGQLAILRVAGRASAPYMLVQHRALSRLAGVSDEQIGAVELSDFDRDCFSHVQKLVLAFTDEVIEGAHVSDSLFERVRSVLTPREIVELLLVIGWYWTACRLTTTLEIEPEHPMGDGVISMLQVEQAKRSAQLAAEISPDDYRVY